MTPEPPVPAVSKSKNPLKAIFGDARLVPMLNYILYFVFQMTLGFAGILAITLIYIFQDGAPEWLKSHYQFQKRTFWIGIGMVIPLILLSGVNARFDTLLTLGLLVAVFGALFVWMVARSVAGFNHLVHHRAYPSPKSWLI